MCRLPASWCLHVPTRYVRVGAYMYLLATCSWMLTCTYSPRSSVCVCLHLITPYACVCVFTCTHSLARVCVFTCTHSLARVCSVMCASTFWDWDECPILSPGCDSNPAKSFRARVRSFVDSEITPFAAIWESGKTFDANALISKAVAAGIYGSTWPEEVGGTPALGLPVLLADFILNDELARSGSGGVLACAFVSLAIGLPPLASTGGLVSPVETREIIRSVVTGQKRIALAVTEAFGGSDVAAGRCFAKRVNDEFLLNGEKTFITGGLSADYLTVSAKTDLGLSLFLVNSKSEGISRFRLETQGWRTSETTRIVFDNVRVPATRLMGKEGAGFKPVMENFNHERWLLAVHANRFSRNCLEDAIAYARVRKTFGKRLIDHQVIRHKLAEMSRVILATHANSMQIMALLGDKSRSAAGPTALFKVQATKTFEFCAREASQVLGGKSFLTGDGPGGRIERAYRDVRVYAIGGGSEEILLDLAAKQAKL